jgi:agmatinase
VRSIVLETPVVALDVVEVAPAYDHAETTVNPPTAWCWRHWGRWRTRSGIVPVDR